MLTINYNQYTPTTMPAQHLSAQKAVGKEADFASLAQQTQNEFKPESSDDVMRAWDRALAETGANPFLLNRISTALVLHVENGQSLSPTFLGKSVNSAKSMVENIIHRIENPLIQPMDKNYSEQELRFYKKFLEFLES